MIILEPINDVCRLIGDLTAVMPVAFLNNFRGLYNCILNNDSTLNYRKYQCPKIEKFHHQKQSKMKRCKEIECSATEKKNVGICHAPERLAHRSNLNISYKPYFLLLLLGQPPLPQIFTTLIFFQPSFFIPFYIISMLIKKNTSLEFPEYNFLCNTHQEKKIYILSYFLLSSLPHLNISKKIKNFFYFFFLWQISYK